ncbi:MAG: hypothetical protein FH751_09030 [Firmicutes bacterium]|nr:hypothetical protein [Bacillota bacterium]
MKKIIGIQQGLDDIKKGLISLGYDVIDLDDNNYMDVLVYKANGEDVSYSNMTNSLNSKGILLINATDKSIEDIDYMIKKRVYSPLFQ